MEYTDFANDETRLNSAEKADTLYHARKLVDILSKSSTDIRNENW